MSVELTPRGTRGRESLRATERAEAWRRIGALAPGYAAYQEKTDREIPIVRLRDVP